jgi:hypothetical protein
MAASPSLTGEIAGYKLDLLIGVTLRKLVHDSRRALARLELLHALDDQVS